jgi:N-acetylmuramoyl-L-alanine amidase
VTVTRLALAIVAVLFTHVAAPALAEPLQHARVIVIDPGHGGDDLGGFGVAGVAEKHLTLRTSLALRDALLAHDPSLTIVMTREDDTYPELGDRTTLANGLEADLFISVHDNWAENELAEGIETFHLDPDGTRPGDVTPGQSDVGPTVIESEIGTSGEVVEMIIEDFVRSGATRRSRGFALALQESVIDAVGGVTRGVRQQQFRVLRGARMPAVVTELGFLSHAEEGKRVFEPGHQARLVAGLTHGVLAWDAAQAALAASGELR